MTSSCLAVTVPLLFLVLGAAAGTQDGLMGYNPEAGKFTPSGHLVAAVRSWGPYYVGAMKRVRQGHWQSIDDCWPITSEIVGLSAFGPAVPDAVEEAQ